MDQINETTNYASSFMQQIINALPTILGSLLILLIGYVISKAVAALVRKVLAAASLNQRLHAGKGGSLIRRAVPDPVKLISNISFWLIFLFAVSVATSALGIPVLDRIINGIYAYIPNVIAALVIFLTAGVISTGAATLAANTMGDTPTGKIIATAVPTVVMGLAIFMILNQLKVAPEIVTITYAGIVGTATLAFGLGGKDAASKFFLDLYETGQRKKDTAAQDFKKGTGNAKIQADNLQDKIQQHVK